MNLSTIFKDERQKAYICSMQFLKRLFDFYINSSIHVALAVYALVRITGLYFGFESDEPLNYFIFYSTISGYNFVKYAGVARLHHLSLTDDLKAIQIFSLICFILTCYYGWLLPLRTLGFFVPFALLTFFYAVPFWGGFKKNLRNIAELKIIAIAFVWAGVTVLIPVFHAEKNIDTQVILYAVQRFLIVAVLILPFDIRDLKYDDASLKTIPQKIGVRRTKKLGLTLLLFSLVIEFMFSPTAIAKNSFIVFFFVLLLLLMRAKTDQSKYYSSFWVEALPVFWWLFLLGMLNFNTIF